MRRGSGEADLATTASRGVAIATLVLIVLVGPAIPPSQPKPGLAEGARALLGLCVPVLAFAFLLAAAAVLLNRRLPPKVVRGLTVSALVGLNISAGLASRYGVDTFGVAVTLVAAVVLVAYEYGAFRVRSVG